MESIKRTTNERLQKLIEGLAKERNKKTSDYTVTYRLVEYKVGEHEVVSDYEGKAYHPTEPDYIKMPTFSIYESTGSDIKGLETTLVLEIKESELNASKSITVALS